MKNVFKLSAVASFMMMLFLFPVKNSFGEITAVARQDSSARKAAPKKNIARRKTSASNNDIYYKGGPLYLIDVPDSSSNR